MQIISVYAMWDIMILEVLYVQIVTTHAKRVLESDLMIV
jgi:hypothetical protein